MMHETSESVKGSRSGLYQSGSDGAGPDRKRGSGGGGQEPDTLGTFAQPVSILLACARVNSPEADGHPMLARRTPENQVDRRVTPRHESIALSDSERVRVRQMTARALGCGVSMISLTRAVPHAQGVTQQRLVMSVPCGTRMCEACDAERRKREAGRVEGHWRLFWTVGVPAGAWRADVAWRLSGTWAKALFRELRRELARGDGARVKVDEAERERIAALNAARSQGTRKLAVLQYAWCLEPHKSGWPHLHFVTNAHFIGFEWMKAVWSRVISADVQWARYERVTDTDGVCRYLSKYISKTTFSPDITAIMYRRRQWASTTPNVKVKKAGWEREDGVDQRDLFLETVEPDAVAGSWGWTAKLSKAGEYATFEREFSKEEWNEFEVTRHRADRFDRDRVFLEDPEWDAHEDGRRVKLAARLDLERLQERRRRGIYWDGERGKKELAEKLFEEAKSELSKG